MMTIHVSYLMLEAKILDNSKKVLTYSIFEQLIIPKRKKTQPKPRKTKSLNL